MHNFSHVYIRGPVLKVLTWILCVFQHNHLVGLKKTYLKLLFKHVDDLISVKQTINRAVKKNKERLKGSSIYTTMLTRYVPHYLAMH